MSIPTTSQGTKAKVVVPSKQVLEIQTLADLTMNLIDLYFPLLKKAPDIRYVAMAIWGLESGWRVWPNGKNSRHYSATKPENSSLMGKGYYYSPVIQNLVLSNPSAQVKEAIQDAFYPHGLTACMGCYHVAGTPNNLTDFRPHAKVVSDLGLEVGPGESITALFPNTLEGKQRSIASGLIILNNKFKAGLAKYPNSEAAIKYAVGAYVGKAGAKDVNGYTPEMRTDQVYATRSNRLDLLAQAGIVRSGESGTYISKGEVTLASAQTTSNGSTVQNDQTRTAQAGASGTGIVQC